MFGNCYHYALETFYDLHTGLSSGTVTIGSNSGAFEVGDASQPGISLPQLGDSPRLVHGFIVGNTGELKDVKFGHAWLEGNGYVMDCGSAGKEHALVPRERYYTFWRIKPEECHHYTIEEATQHILRTGSISGWHDPPPDAVTVEIKRGAAVQRNLPSPDTSAASPSATG